MKNFSLLYFFIKLWMRCALKMHFLKIGVEGKLPIPKENGLLICANHQNAFLDGIVLAVLMDRQISFFSRSDVFNNPIAGFLLGQLNIIPIYRKRDEGNSKEKNVAVFEHAANCLANGGTMLIFPEGNHSTDRRLRTLQKGFARISFAAMEKQRAVISILPVGIDYGEHNGFWSGLFVRFGKLINVADFKTSFEENDKAAYNELRKELRSKMQPLIPHLVKTELAPLEEIWEKWSASKMIAIGADFFDDRKQLATKLMAMSKQQQQQLFDHYQKYRYLLESSVSKKPVLNWGFLNDTKFPNSVAIFVMIYYPLILVVYFFDRIAALVARKLFKDPQFYGGVRMLINQLIYFVLTILFFLLLWNSFLLAFGLFIYLVFALAMLPHLFSRWKLSLKQRLWEIRTGIDSKIIKDLHVVRGRIQRIISA